MAGSCSSCCDWRASERRDWGQIFVREVRELLLVLLRALMTRVCSQFCFALVFFVCWRGQKRGHMMVNVVVCFVENRCSLCPPRCAEGMTMQWVRVHAVQLVSVVVLLVKLA